MDMSKEFPRLKGLKIKFGDDTSIQLRDLCGFFSRNRKKTLTEDTYVVHICSSCSKQIPEGDVEYEKVGEYQVEMAECPECETRGPTADGLSALRREIERTISLLE